MFFEGSEKKAEIIVDPGKLSLLDDFDETFWAEMVECCDAQILSSISNEKCTAYLLSESSLFVWADRLVILTCGQTRLVSAVDYFLKKVDSSVVLQTIYQRKNEHLAHAQHSSFVDDVQLLEGHVKGKACLFGEMHGHHQYLYYQDNGYLAAADDRTYELLVYQISQNASNALTNEDLTCEAVRDFFRIEQLLPGFEVDDFVFNPFGYSLNAIRGDDYFTIHVTPQSISSYVSFESNLNLIDMLPTIRDILNPLSIDLVAYNEPEFRQKAKNNIGDAFVCKNAVEGMLPNGYIVNFANYIVPQPNVVAPVNLKLSGDQNVF